MVSISKSQQSSPHLEWTCIALQTYFAQSLPGNIVVKIGDNIVVGALGFVNKDLTEEGIYAGLPVKLIKKK